MVKRTKRSSSKKKVNADSSSLSNKEMTSYTSESEASKFVNHLSKQAGEISTAHVDSRISDIKTERVNTSENIRVINQKDRNKSEQIRNPLGDNFSKSNKENGGIKFERADFDDYKFVDQNVIDPNLHTGPRILVPVDVQAYVVPRQSSGTSTKKSKSVSEFLSPIDEKYVKSTSSTNPRADLHVTEKSHATRDDVYGLPPAFDQEDNPSSSLEPGIHLFWALPDALMRGQEREVSRETDDYLQLDDEIPTEIAGSRTGISYGDAIRESLEFEVEDESMDLSDFEFPQLPDRWLIVRQWKSDDGTMLTKKWVLESDSGESSPLETWSSPGKSDFSSQMTAVGPGSGDIFWSVTYDSARNRFTFHDIPEDRVNGPFDYLVAGWYSDENKDPLWMPMNTAETEWQSYFEDELLWKLPHPWLGGYVDGDPVHEYLPIIRFTPLHIHTKTGDI